MPLIVQSIASALGDTLIYDESDPGGYTLAMHSTYAPTISKIFSQPWDLVVLQEQSQLPAFPPAEVDTEVYPYAHRLDSMIHANDTCTQTVFLMTWGHANGDPMNCATYPVICTYAGMQERLRESYLQMTQDNSAIVAPVGMAWKFVMDSIPSIWLYQSDSSHASVPGSYLEACVMYSTIFHRHTYGCSYTDGLTTVVAQTLQQVSDRVVFDSLWQWQHYGHYPYAGFKNSISGTTATLTEQSPVPANDYWRFGDLVTDTASDPVHTYTSNGTYVIKHTASNSCFSETLTDTIHIGTTNVSQIKERATEFLVQQHGNGSVTFSMPQGTPALLDVYDLAGRLLASYTLSGTDITDSFVRGTYIYRLRTLANTAAGKFVVY